MLHHLTPQFILDKWIAGEENGRFPAVTLFLDLSGFTPLSAHLRQYSKAGAEELANLMHQIFNPLINSVYAHGGFVVGFAGDAFKAVFPELRIDSHLAALAAGQEIRQAMQANQQMTTLFGTFTLGARISLASGPVSWQIWQGTASTAYEQSHAYSFAGAALDEAIKGEVYADVGELVMTEAVYHVLHRAIGLTAVSLPATAYFSLTHVSTPLPPPQKIITAQTELEPTMLDQASLFYPTTLLNQRTRGEFRHVVSLFLSVSGLEQQDASFMGIFFRLVHQYGGYLCRIGRGGASETGRTFLLFWGAPTAHENDIERALNFVLDLRTQTAVSPAVRLRAGLTYQMVYAGFVGSSLREEYTCYGLRVNLAARLMVAANWGEIWLDEEIVSRAQDSFRFALAGKRPFKGFDEPLTVYRLERVKQLAETTFFQHDMVGRAAELSALQTAVQPIYNGQFGGIITIAGEAGIGKSRLVHQFLESLSQQTTILLCQTDEILRESLNPFRYFLRHYFDQQPSRSEQENKTAFDTILNRLIAAAPEPVLQAELERTRSFLGALVGLRWAGSLYELLEPNLRQENSFMALKSLIKAESLRQPLILQLEDSHWLDGDSQQFLVELMRHVASCPFVILTTTRQRESLRLLPATHETRLVLQTLLPTEAKQLAQALLQTAVSPTLVELLHTRTDGNPFFIEQLVLYLQEQQLLEASAEGLVPKTAVSSTLPSNLQAILVSRIDQLTQAVRSVVQTAAVLGREFDVAILAGMLRGETAVSEKIKTAESAAIWSALTELRYLFRHALLRDAAYDMQLQAQRRTLHQIAANTIEQIFAADLSPYYADLVYHHRQADNPKKELLYAIQAGKQAFARANNTEALFYFNRALTLVPTTETEQQYDIYLYREQIHDFLGKREAQTADLEILQQLALQTTDPTSQLERIITIELRRAEQAHYLGQFEEATQLTETAIALAAQHQFADLQGRAHHRLSQIQVAQGDYEATRKSLQIAREFAQQAGQKELEARILNSLGIVGMETAVYAQGEKDLQAALQLFSELDKKADIGNVYSNLAVILSYQNKTKAAQEYAQKAVTNHQLVGYRRGYGNALLVLANIALDQGNFSAALTLYERATAVYQEINYRSSLAIARITVGNLYIRLNQNNLAQQMLLDGLTIARDIDAKYILTANLHTFGYLQMRLGNLTQATELFAEGVVLAQEIGAKSLLGTLYFSQGKLLQKQGQTNKAKKLYEETLTLFRDIGEPHKAMEPLAALAEMAWQTGELNQAKRYAGEIYDFIKDSFPADITDPFYIFSVCCRILEAVEASEAPALWERAYTLLQEQANSIEQPKWQQAFLESWDSHREILAVFPNPA